MNYEDIKKLIDDMGNSKIDELNIEFPDGIKISMKKDKAPVMPPMPQETVQYITVPEKKVEEKVEQKNEVSEEYKIVKSPMVGTFYSKSSPDAKEYVEVGSKVKKGDILCIVEAMKLMNEIESEFDGEIVEICVNNEDVVEYGTPLFKIK